MPQVTVDEYVLNTLMADLVGHDGQPSAFIVYLYLWYASRLTRRVVQVSYQRIAEATGLSRTAVQLAVKKLKERALVRVELASPTAVPVYHVLRPWIRRRATK